MCGRIVSEDPFTVVYSRDKYENPGMCDGAVDNCLEASKFIPDWFVTSKMVEKFDNSFTHYCWYTQL